MEDTQVTEDGVPERKTPPPQSRKVYSSRGWHDSDHHGDVEHGESPKDP